MNDHESFEGRLEHDVRQAVREGAAHAEALSLEVHDRHVVGEERAFRARFGFDRPRRDRENLIRLKHEADLTDREIRLLKFTCSLRFDADSVRLVASRILAIFGRIVMGFLALEGLEAWGLASESSLPVPVLLLRLAGVMVILLVMGWAVQQIYLRPWQIRERVRKRETDNLTSPQAG